MVRKAQSQQAATIVSSICPSTHPISCSRSALLNTRRHQLARLEVTPSGLDADDTDGCAGVCLAPVLAEAVREDLQMWALARLVVWVVFDELWAGHCSEGGRKLKVDDARRRVVVGREGWFCGGDFGSWTGGTRRTQLLSALESEEVGG